MVSYCDQPVKGGPFSCKAYDAGQVIVKHMPSLASVNQPVSFNSKSMYMYLIGFKLAYMVIRLWSIVKIVFIETMKLWNTYLSPLKNVPTFLKIQIILIFMEYAPVLDLL